MYASTDVRDKEISFGATLSPIALRNLFDHSAVHLNVEWRDLPGTGLVQQGPHHPGPRSPGHRNRVDAQPRSLDPRRGPGQRRHIRRHPRTRSSNGSCRDITGAWKTRGTDTGLLIKVRRAARTRRSATPAPRTRRSSPGPCPASSNGPPAAAPTASPPHTTEHRWPKRRQPPNGSEPVGSEPVTSGSDSTNSTNSTIAKNGTAAGHPAAVPRCSSRQYAG